MSNSPKNTIMDNLSCNNKKDAQSPPPHPPVLLRQNATWDDRSMQIERERVNKILANMGIAENYNQGY